MSQAYSITEQYAASLVNPSYLKQGTEALRRRQKLVQNLLQQRRMPDEGWDSQTIKWWLAELAMLDSNNFEGNVGAGEREGRIVCDLVRERHHNLGHGIGRSGDVAAVQPKAAGSSVIYQITRCMVRDLIQNVVGMKQLKGILVVPLATGMSILLVLLALRQSFRPRAKYVLWTRIDQKTCFKAIKSAGLEVVVVENKLVGDSVQTDMDALRAAMASVPGGSENVLCVISTTSCFAPRVPDDLEAIARFAKEHQIGHVVNNAYGLQCSKCAHRINQAVRSGVVSAVVQSTDKNLMVPVGGSIIAGPDKKFVEETVSQTYPGRANMSPILDVFMTLLSQGSGGFRRLYKERRGLANEYRTDLAALAQRYGERLLDTKGNSISFAVSLGTLGRKREAVPGGPPAQPVQTVQGGKDGEAGDLGAKGPRSSQEQLVRSDISAFGSLAFTRGISGARVVAPGTRKTVVGTEFEGYGASISNYPVPYITVACAVGVTKEEFKTLLTRLEKLFKRVGMGKNDCA